MKVRHAVKADKEEILKFCINTFEWGDYIDQVWDIWYSQRDGSLLVIEEEEGYGIQGKRPSVIALGHASLCPDKRSVWLEGIRVDPKYRRRSIATRLLNQLLSYGKEQGATQASAIVADNNIASQSMMRRNGFVVISKWNYFTSDKIYKKGNQDGLTSKVASREDTEMISNYLRHSYVYKASGGSYVNSWRWYFLDTYSNTLIDLIDTNRILINGSDLINGLAIINKLVNNDYRGDVNKIKTSLQIVYLDATSVSVLKDLVHFAIDLIQVEGVSCNRLQVYIPQISYVSAAMELVGTRESEKFLLYKKEI